MKIKIIGAAGSKSRKHYYPLCDKISIDYALWKNTSKKRALFSGTWLERRGTWESIFDELVKMKIKSCERQTYGD